MIHNTSMAWMALETCSSLKIGKVRMVRMVRKVRKVRVVRMVRMLRKVRELCNESSEIPFLLNLEPPYCIVCH